MRARPGGASALPTPSAGAVRAPEGSGKAGRLPCPGRVPGGADAAGARQPTRHPESSGAHIHRAPGPPACTSAGRAGARQPRRLPGPLGAGIARASARARRLRRLPGPCGVGIAGALAQARPPRRLSGPWGVGIAGAPARARRLRRLPGPTGFGPPAPPGAVRAAGRADRRLRSSRLRAGRRPGQCDHGSPTSATAPACWNRETISDSDPAGEWGALSSGVLAGWPSSSEWRGVEAVQVGHAPLHAPLGLAHGTSTEHRVAGAMTMARAPTKM